MRHGTQIKTRYRSSGFFPRRSVQQLVFARTGLRGFFTLFDIFFNELRQALDETAAATNHVQPALMLMFFQNIVQFVLKICHSNLRAMYLAEPNLLPLS